MQNKIIIPSLLFYVSNLSLLTSCFSLPSRAALVGIVYYGLSRHTSFISRADVLTPPMLTLLIGHDLFPYINDSASKTFVFAITLFILRRLCPEYY